VNQGENRMAGKHLIEYCELCGSGVGDKRRRSVKVEGNRNEDGDSASGDGYANHRQKNDRAPKCSSESSSGFHTGTTRSRAEYFQMEAPTKQSWPARVLLAKYGVSAESAESI